MFPNKSNFLANILLVFQEGNKTVDCSIFETLGDRALTHSSSYVANIGPPVNAIMPEQLVSYFI